MLQYLTDNNSSLSVEDQVSKVLDLGCEWIELDTRGVSDIRIKEIVSNIMPKCLEKEVFLIMRDNIDLAKEVNVGGVALSLGSGEFPSHARASLGAAAVIGVEVNTTDQIAALKGLDVDYVLLAPFKVSDESDATPLGVKGIKELCDYMKAEQLEFPRVAIGGVLAGDVEALLDAGCNSVATSDLSAFTNP